MSEQQYQLIVQKGPQPGKIFLLITENISVGRDPMADISLNDPEVSRQHVRLTRTASGYVLEDLVSTNGTFINGEQLEADMPTALVPGQTVSMGSGVTMLYEIIGSEPTEPEPVEELFDAFSPVVSEPDVNDLLDPYFEESPEFPEEPPAAAVEPQPPQYTPTPQTPLVPSGNSEQQKKRRRMITIAVVSLVLLCCCCLLFMLSAYFYWGDPLMQSLGLY